MAHDSTHQIYLVRLRALLMRRWWLTTGGLWLTVGLLSLWSLRAEFAQIQQYFTWTAVRYGLAYNRLSAAGLGLCVGLTVALLLSESRYLLFGLSKAEQQQLEQLLRRINHQGNRHPLWRKLYQDL